MDEGAADGDALTWDDVIQGWTPKPTFGGVYFRRDELVASGGETALTLDATPLDGSVEIWKATSTSALASLLLSGAYTATGPTTVALTTAATAGEVYVVQYATTTPSPGASGFDAAFFDDFTRADSSSSLGGTWTTGSGTWGISGDQAKLFTATAILSFAWVDPGVGDGTISVDVPTFWGSANNGGWGIAFRYTDPNNNYVADFSSGGLYKIVGGTATLLASFGSAMNSSDTCVVEMSGSSITCKRIRGGTTTTLAVVTDSTYDNTHTKCGLYAFGSDTVSRFDNFQVV